MSTLFAILGAWAGGGGAEALSLPESWREAINKGTGPVIYSVGTTAGLVVLFFFREFFVFPSLLIQEKIARWVDSGAPLGNPADLPPPLDFGNEDEWSIGEPDLVFESPEIVVPAGFNQIVYEPQFGLNSARDNYSQVGGTEQALLETPLPISMMFWAGPGEESTVLKVASAYEAATKHRIPPPDFGPLAGEP